MKKYYIEYNANQYTPELDTAIVDTYNNSKNINPFNICGAIAKVFETLPNAYSKHYNRFDFMLDLKYLNFIGYDLIETEDKNYILIYWADGLDSVIIYPCEY